MPVLHDSDRVSFKLAAARFFSVSLSGVYCFFSAACITMSFKECHCLPFTFQCKHNKIFHYQVSILDSLDDIYSHIDRDQLTADYGGTFEYNHLAWVEFQRVNYEVVV